MLEEPTNDGQIGEVFTCIIGRTFEALKKGDRFYFTHPEAGFTPGAAAYMTSSSAH